MAARSCWHLVPRQLVPTYSRHRPGYQASGLESTWEWPASGFQAPTEFTAEIKIRKPDCHLFVVARHGNCELHALLGVIDAVFGDDVFVSPIVGHREMCNICAIP